MNETPIMFRSSHSLEASEDLQTTSNHWINRSGSAR